MKTKPKTSHAINDKLPFNAILSVQNVLSTYGLVTVGLISLLINSLILIDYQKSPFSQFLLWDAALYWKKALEISGGDWIGNAIFHQAPFYPYLLSVFISIFGERLLPIYLFQCIAGAVSSMLVYSISTKITNNRWVGLLSGLLYSFYGMQVFFTTKILSECVAIFLLLLTVRLLLSSKPLKSTWLSGFSFGLLLLIKPHFLIATPFIILYYYIFPKRNSFKHLIKFAICFLIPLLLVVSMVTIRNYYVGHEFILISSNGGENFYIGSHDKATGTFTPIDGVSTDIAFQNTDIIAAAQTETGRQLTRSEVSKYWFNKGVSFIVKNPSKYLALEWTKFKDIFSGAELTNMYILQFEKHNLTGSFKMAFVGFYLLFPLFLVGLKATFSQWKKFYIILLMIFINISSMMIFFYDSRFMLLSMPFFIMLSGLGLWNIFLAISKTKIIKNVILHPTIIVFLIGIFLTFSIYHRDKTFKNQDWNMWMTLGEVYYGLDQFEKSVDMFVKSSGLNKGNCMPSFGVSKALFKMGKKDLAVQIYTNTIRTVNSDDRKTIMRDSDFNDLREYNLLIADKAQNMLQQK